MLVEKNGCDNVIVKQRPSLYEFVVDFVANESYSPQCRKRASTRTPAIVKRLITRISVAPCPWCWSTQYLICVLNISENIRPSHVCIKTRILYGEIVLMQTAAWIKPKENLVNVKRIYVVKRKYK